MAGLAFLQEFAAEVIYRLLHQDRDTPIRQTAHLYGFHYGVQFLPLFGPVRTDLLMPPHLVSFPGSGPDHFGVHGGQHCAYLAGIKRVIRGSNKVTVRVGDGC